MWVNEVKPECLGIMIPHCESELFDTEKTLGEKITHKSPEPMDELLQHP